MSGGNGPKPEMHSSRPAYDPERRRWQDPEAILLDTGLTAGSTIIDLGCGGGFFALPAARIVGNKGKVYGVDTNAVAIADLQERASAENLHNLYLTVGSAEETIVCKHCADIVFVGMALHDFQDPSRVLENALKMVKASGRLVNLDWKKEPMELGPPVSIRFSEEVAAGLIEGAGFTVEAIKDSGPYHYLVVARP